MAIKRLLLAAILLTAFFVSIGQKHQNSKVSFVAIIDVRNATKDGIYINGYVVNISYSKLLNLNGKKVRITGVPTTVKGIQQKKGDELRQGRQEDRKHILKPIIQIVDP